MAKISIGTHGRLVISSKRESEGTLTEADLLEVLVRENLTLTDKLTFHGLEDNRVEMEMVFDSETEILVKADLEKLSKVVDELGLNMNGAVNVVSPDLERIVRYAIFRNHLGNIAVRSTFGDFVWRN